MNKEDPVIRALRELNSTQSKHLSRLLACEALLYSLLPLVPKEAVAALEERFEHARDVAMSQVPPNKQHPTVWEPFAEAIAAIRPR